MLVFAKINDVQCTINIDNKSGYCYDVFCLNTNHISNDRLEIILPTNFSNVTVKQYINFLTGNAGLNETCYLRSGFKLCHMLCDDNYFKYLLTHVFVCLESGDERGTHCVNMIRKLDPILQDEIWLQFPYQLLPHDIIDNKEFMTIWERVKDNKKVIVGDNMYVYKTNKCGKNINIINNSGKDKGEKSVTIYRRNIHTYKFVGPILSMSWYPGYLQLKSKVYHTYDNITKISCKQSTDWDSDGNIRHNIVYDSTTGLPVSLTCGNSTDTNNRDRDRDRNRKNKNNINNDSLMTVYYD